MKRRTDRQQDRTLGAFLLGDVHGPLDRGLMARHHNLPRVVVVRCLADFALCSLVSHSPGRLEIETQQRSHRTDAHWNRLLHRLPTQAQQSGSVRYRQRSGGRQRRVLTQGMTRDIRRCSHGYPFGFHCPHRCQRGCHERGLGVCSQGQIILSTFPYQGRKLLAQGLIDFLENFRCC